MNNINWNVIQALGNVV